ncbi:MAG: nuclear transport factor 2 family protein [Puia sp.]|nr:nuclear transport factor 2 family protein [Puia sp.]
MEKLACIFLLVACLFSDKLTLAQDKADIQDNAEIFKTIAHMDSVLFGAFNNHDLATLQKVFAPNTEFYHDRDGLSNYGTTMTNFKRVFASTPDLHRDLVPGTLEVYPLPGYGAVEMGEHRFTHTQNGQIIAAVYKFINTWQFKDGQWQVTRTISVGH